MRNNPLGPGSSLCFSRMTSRRTKRYLPRLAAGSPKGSRQARAKNIAWRLAPRRGVVRRKQRLIPELLGQHALFEAVLAVEHHEKLDGACLFDVDLDDVARLEVIGDGADRPLLVFQN